MAGQNPYAAPSSVNAGPTGMPGDPNVTPGMIEALGQTRPWVAFLSVLGFIFAGLMVLGALGMMIGGAASEIPGGPAIGLFYLVLAIFYAVPSVYLYRYGSSIRNVQSGYGVQAVEEALRHQKSFWKLVGIMTIVFIALYLIAVIVMVGVMGAAGAGAF